MLGFYVVRAHWGKPVFEKHTPSKWSEMLSFLPSSEVFAYEAHEPAGGRQVDGGRAAGPVGQARSGYVHIEPGRPQYIHIFGFDIYIYIYIYIYIFVFSTIPSPKMVSTAKAGWPSLWTRKLPRHPHMYNKNLFGVWGSGMIPNQQ